VNAIVADPLTKRFGDFAAVDGVSFEIPAGQLVAVLGPNGAGKTAAPRRPPLAGPDRPSR
jgi:ABC-2 type transport system ATP-binding protein